METNDKRVFAEALIGMGEVYDRKITPALASVYFDDLAEFDLQEVLSAFTAHRKDPERGRFFPKVADLIDKLAGTNAQIAAVAWSELLPRLRDSRRAMSEDPITERVVQDLGGWVILGSTPTDKLVWVEKEFIKRYEIYAMRRTDLKQIERSGLRLI